MARAAGAPPAPRTPRPCRRYRCSCRCSPAGASSWCLVAAATGPPAPRRVRPPAPPACERRPAGRPGPPIAAPPPRCLAARVTRRAPRAAPLRGRGARSRAALPAAAPGPRGSAGLWAAVAETTAPAPRCLRGRPTRGASPPPLLLLRRRHCWRLRRRCRRRTRAFPPRACRGGCALRRGRSMPGQSAPRAAPLRLRRRPGSVSRMPLPGARAPGTGRERQRAGAAARAG
jgi:hypothetical protein